MVESSLSSEVSAITILPAPSNLTATVNAGSVDLSWTNNDDSVDGNIIIQRSSDSGSTYTDAATIAYDATSYSETPPSGQPTYDYRVKRQTDHASTISNTVSVTFAITDNPILQSAEITVTPSVNSIDISESIQSVIPQTLSVSTITVSDELVSANDVAEISNAIILPVIRQDIVFIGVNIQKSIERLSIKDISQLSIINSASNTSNKENINTKGTPQNAVLTSSLSLRESTIAEDKSLSIQTTPSLLQSIDDTSATSITDNLSIQSTVNRSTDKLFDRSITRKNISAQTSIAADSVLAIAAKDSVISTQIALFGADEIALVRPPQNVRAFAVRNEISVSWEDPTNIDTRYAIFRSEDKPADLKWGQSWGTNWSRKSAFRLIRMMQPDETEYVDKELEFDTTYSYQIATIIAEETPLSPEVNDIQAYLNNEENGYELTWRGIDEADRYLIYRSVNPGQTVDDYAALDSTTKTSYSDLFDKLYEDDYGVDAAKHRYRVSALVIE